MKKLLTCLLAFVMYMNVLYVYSDGKVYAEEIECEYLYPEYCNNVLTNGLASNETTLFYMYGDEYGHYFLDPLAGEENVIFADNEEIMFTADMLHHGKWFVGVFVDDTLWELESLEEVVFE